MSTENTSVETVDTDLDTFSAEFFSRNPAPSEEANSEEGEIEDEPESDAPSEDTHADADDTSAPDNDDDTDEEEVEEAPKPKKNRFQERIDEVVGKQREAERRAQELEAKLTEALQRLEKDTKPDPTPKVTEVDTGPQPTDINDDGTVKYPLGEFDPIYIKDLMKFTLNEETKIRETQREERRQQEERDAAAAELQSHWNEKLVPAKERYPDFQEKGEQMLTVFQDIEPAYGEYLTNTIMEMEYGPDVFYYLANNIDEAQKIVQSGAKKATITLGRLEGKFADADEVKQKARPRVSKAPEPPEHLNKGSAVTKPTIRGDEKDVDLDAFSRELFRKKR